MLPLEPVWLPSANGKFCAVIPWDLEMEEIHGRDWSCNDHVMSTNDNAATVAFVEGVTADRTAIDDLKEIGDIHLDVAPASAEPRRGLGEDACGTRGRARS